MTRNVAKICIIYCINYADVLMVLWCNMYSVFTYDTNASDKQYRNRTMQSLNT